MTKINPRHLHETIHTSGYTHTQNNQQIQIYTPNGTPIATGHHTTTGRLHLAFPTLQKTVTTLTDLAQTLDQLKQENEHTQKP